VTEERHMKSMVVGALAAAVVLTGGVALAQSGSGAGPDPGHHGAASSASVKKFQRETLALRDELAAKRVDLEDEYDKAEPDIVDIEAKIQTVADKYAIRPWGRGHRGGMMHGWDGAGYARGSGGGCGCGW
jgi:flagellar motility protein MotE (MotC chaperone)